MACQLDLAQGCLQTCICLHGTSERVQGHSTTSAMQDIPLEIVFEDEHLLVVNKPAGLAIKTYPSVNMPLISWRPDHFWLHTSSSPVPRHR